MKNAVVLCFAAIVLLVLGQSGRAQSTTGEVLGTVRDPSGAVLPSASLDIREINTGASRHTTSNLRGDYIIRALPIGRYEITVES